MNNSFKALDFIKNNLLLINEASKYIQNFKLNEEYKLDIEFKGKNDPLTKADLTSQFIIQNGIWEKYSKLDIVGEEDSNVNSIKLEKKILFEKIFKYEIMNFNDIENKLIDQEYNFDNSLLFIDPIDGTKEYINNNFNNVTTLIGLAENNKPSLGIISKPFGKNFIKNSKEKINPQVFFSFKNNNKIIKCDIVEKENYKIFLENIEIIVNQNEGINNLRMVKSDSRKLLEDDKLIEKLNPKNILKLNGSGNKFVNLIENKSNCMVYFSNKTSKWDTCAGEALINSLNGSVFNFNKENYEYIKEENYYNKNGVFVGLNKEICDFIKKNI